MSVALTKSDLMTVIKQKELDGLTDKFDPDKTEDELVTAAIAEALGEITLSIDPDSIDEDGLTKIWKIIAVAALYPPEIDLPKRRKDELDWARGMLKEMRAGTAGNNEGAWNSDVKQSFNFNRATESTRATDD